jgi:hypothetical protein
MSKPKSPICGLFASFGATGPLAAPASAGDGAAGRDGV